MIIIPYMKESSFLTMVLFIVKIVNPIYRKVALQYAFNCGIIVFENELFI